MERRAFPIDFDTCSLCGQPFAKGQHWIPGDGGSYICLVSLDVPPEGAPRMDVLFGTAHIPRLEIHDGKRPLD